MLLARTDVRTQQGEVRIRAARVLDGTGQILSNVTVVVKGSNISAIDPDPTGSVDVDLGQATLLPGLIDVHAHIGWHFGANGRFEFHAPTPAQDALYAAENAYITLMAGVTTLQSPGQPIDVDLRNAIARGALPGPRVLTSILQITPAIGSAADMRRTLQLHCGVFRFPDLLVEGVAKIKEIAQRAGRTEISDKSKVFNTARVEALELDNLIEVARATLVSAEARKESRGAHDRSDFPHRDDDHWMRHTLWYKEGDRLDYRPVKTKPLTVAPFEPKARVY